MKCDIVFLASLVMFSISESGLLFTDGSSGSCYMSIMPDLCFFHLFFPLFFALSLERKM